MKKQNKILRGFKEINNASKIILPSNMLAGIFLALQPFINVFFIAKIVNELIVGENIKNVIPLAFYMIFLNFIFFILKHLFEQIYFSSFNKLSLYEEQKINNVLLNANFSLIEDSNFDSTLRRYKEAKEMKDHLGYLNYIFLNFIRGLTGVIVCSILLIPFFKISFKRTGQTFIGSPYFALVVFVGMIFLIGLIYFINKKNYKVYKKFREDYLKLTKIMNYYVDLITNYKNGKDIRIFNAQNLIVEDATSRLLTEGVKVRKKKAYLQAINSSFIAVIGAVIGFGVYLLLGLKGLIGAVSVDEIVLYMGTFLLLINSVIAIFNIFGALFEVVATIQYYFDIIDTKFEMIGTESFINNKPFEIEYKNVSFKYDGQDKYALKNFSIKIRSSDKLAVVGENGSGKTTFIKLLTGMYDNYDGEILLNGINIKNIIRDEYNKIFAVVFQDFSIYSFKVFENISADENYDYSLLNACLNDSGIKERVDDFKDGVDTFLYRDYEKEGLEISVGEGQKLALARALYKNSEVIILDEPTASLDPIAEYDLYVKFNQFVKNKIAIYISHRLSSCRFCSKIAVFDNGELKEFGTHEELIKNVNGKYYELWDAQAKYYI